MLSLRKSHHVKLRVSVLSPLRAIAPSSPSHSLFAPRLALMQSGECIFICGRHGLIAILIDSRCGVARGWMVQPLIEYWHTHWRFLEGRSCRLCGYTVHQRSQPDIICRSIPEEDGSQATLTANHHSEEAFNARYKSSAPFAHFYLDMPSFMASACAPSLRFVTLSSSEAVCIRTPRTTVCQIKLENPHVCFLFDHTQHCSCSTAYTHL
jgi:hypothetical protein